MTDACRPEKVLNTHSAIMHKTHGVRPVSGTTLDKAFHEDETTHHMVGLAKHSPETSVPHHPSHMMHPASSHIMHPAHVDHHDNKLSVKEHHDAVAETHETKTVKPHNLSHAMKTAPVAHVEKKSPNPHMDLVHPSTMQSHINSCKQATAALPESTHGEHKQKTSEHLSDAAHSLNKIQALKHENEKHKGEVVKAHHKMKAAEAEAVQSHTHLEQTKIAHSQGKTTLKAVASATKDAAHKTQKAHHEAANVVQKKKDLDKHTAELDKEKVKAGVAAEAVNTQLHIASKTTTGPSKAHTDKVAEHCQKALKPLVPKHAPAASHKVKTDCDFLQDAVLLTDLKKLSMVHGKEMCIGFGSYIEKGEQKLGAVKCSVDPHTHACPAHFDASLCHVVPLDVSKLEPYFKDIFH